MRVSRRAVLSLGAAAAADSLLVSCVGDAGRATKPPVEKSTGAAAPDKPWADRGATEGRDARGGATFMGIPEEGHLYFGASLPYYRSLPAWETRLGESLALNRSYFRPGQTGRLVEQAKQDLGSRRLPHVSIKPPGTWADVASGRLDRWLVGLLAGLHLERHPVFLSITHEPENDAGPAGMQPWDFVAMQRRAIRLARETAPNVTVVPILQAWTFDPSRSDSRPAAWVVPEADVFGLDAYNPWAPGNGKPWRSFASRVDEALPWVGSKPIAIGEYGCRIDPSYPARTAEWLRDAVEYARTHNVVSMSYFNSRLNSPDGSFELKGQTEVLFARLLKSPWVSRPI
jgi:hypothetical protein